MNRFRTSCPLLVSLLVLVALPSARAQVAQRSVLHARNVVVPQAGAFSADPERGGVVVTGVDVRLTIRRRVATTQMDISLKNQTNRRQEAELVVPVPEGAVVKGFAYQGAASEPTATILPAEEATRTYESIVASVRDPALLEFVGWNMVRSSVFPVAAGGTQKVRLTYEHVLPVGGNRVDYVLPRTEALKYSVPWQVEAELASRRPISTVFSPSHKVQLHRLSPNAVRVELAEKSTTDPGPFRLSYLLGGKDIAASLFAYPDPAVGGGYFLLLAGLPPELAETSPSIKREVILVLDRSGSMRGEKLRQAREAARQVIGGLQEGESFNIVAYNQVVDCFADRPVRKGPETVRQAERYLQGITPLGGTNIYDALNEALRTEPGEGMLPVVLFLTDGLPTVGKTSEVAIRDLAEVGNPHGKRVFTFGAGANVNAPLLRGVSRRSRATCTFVLPGEDVEVKIGRVFEQLSGPVLSAPELALAGAESDAAGRIVDRVPAQMPDLFRGDQLVVLGKYLGEQPLNFELRGNYMGRQREFEFSFDLSEATTRNGFVARLWASRKIGVLIEAIQEAGADLRPGSMPDIDANPRLKELVDEVVRLSTEFGILTEYTAFLALEGTDLSNPEAVHAEAGSNFRHRALQDRSGWKGVNQSLNVARQVEQTTVNRRNYFLDKDMNRQQVSTVQQVNDVALYRRQNRWVDSRLVQKGDRAEPDRTVEFGSPEFRALARRLSRQGRQGTIALHGEVLLSVQGETVLVRNP